MGILTLHIFLSILLFLFISLFIIFLISIFIPVNIRGKLKFNGENNRYGDVKVDYLFKLVTFNYRYKLKGDEIISLKIFGFELIGE